MAKETIQEVYSQLQRLQTIDFSKKPEILNPYKRKLKEIFDKISDPPDVAAEEVCQFIRDDKLKHINGFATSIFRMLQTDRLNTDGLQKIIETVKDHHRLK